MDTMQIQFQSVAESHLHLSNLLRESVAIPLSKLLSKQRILRKEVKFKCITIFEYTNMSKLVANIYSKII